MASIVRSARALGNELQRARLSAGFTQHDLAIRTNLRQATISRLENGEGATLQTLFALLTVLDLELRLTQRSTSAPSLDDIF